MKRAPDCLGVRVYFDEKLTDNYAVATGVWPFKRVRIGPALATLPPREREAVLTHEVAHVRLYHLEKRIAHLYLLVWWPWLREYCRRQEIEADIFAAGCGYGREMMMVLERLLPQEKPSAWHPSLRLRIARIYTYLSVGA